LSPEASAAGDTRDIVADAVGMDGRTYEKAKAVVEQVEADPEQYGDLTERPEARDALSVPVRP
jgi:hypothetical protein